MNQGAAGYIIDRKIVSHEEFCSVLEKQWSEYSCHDDTFNWAMDLIKEDSCRRLQPIVVSNGTRIEAAMILAPPIHSPHSEITSLELKWIYSAVWNRKDLDKTCNPFCEDAALILIVSALRISKSMGYGGIVAKSIRKRVGFFEKLGFCSFGRDEQDFQLTWMELTKIEHSEILLDLLSKEKTNLHKISDYGQYQNEFKAALPYRLGHGFFLAAPEGLVILPVDGKSEQSPVSCYVKPPKMPLNWATHLGESIAVIISPAHGENYLKSLHKFHLNKLKPGLLAGSELIYTEIVNGIELVFKEFETEERNVRSLTAFRDFGDVIVYLCSLYLPYRKKFVMENMKHILTQEEFYPIKTVEGSPLMVESNALESETI